MGGVWMGYEQGFLDCLLIVKHYAKEVRSVRELLEKLDYLEVVVEEGRLEQLKVRLGIFK